MMKVIKNNFKLFLGIISGIIVSSVIYVYASSVVATDIAYSNSTLKSTNVQSAIDELNQKISSVGNNCPNYTYSNSNFVKAYSYNESGSNKCITGNENTCVETTCYKSGTCKAGDIIDYKVNSSETVRFHVMFDDCGTITMQSQKNTVYNVKWYTDNDNTQGPLTAISALEDKTRNWSNVNDISYEAGTTVFKTNRYISCTYAAVPICDSSRYTMSVSSAKARMITAQEALQLGCGRNENTCPMWISNFLNGSASHGGTDDTYAENGASANYGYWTLSTISTSNWVWLIDYLRRISFGNTPDVTNAARAVVEVSK